eukprot:1159145-Pelagomonas_calceolata.AAC.21
MLHTGHAREDLGGEIEGNLGGGWGKVVGMMINNCPSSCFAALRQAENRQLQRPSGAIVDLPRHATGSGTQACSPTRLLQ